MMETLNNQAQTDSVHSQRSRSLSRSLTPTNQTTTNHDNNEENLNENEDASPNPTTTTSNINDSKNLHIELVRSVESDDNVKETKENVAVVAVECCEKDDCNNKSDDLLEKGEEYKTLNLSKVEGSCDIVKNETNPLSISSTYDENEFDKKLSLPITERSISVEKEKEESYNSPENKYHPAEDILSNFARITDSVETITAAGSVNSDTQQTNSFKEYDLKVEDENSASQCYSPESSEPEEEATKESTMQQISNVEKEKEENYYSPEDKHHPAEDILSNFSRITASVEPITAAGSVNSDTQQTNSSKEYDLKVEDENSASQCYSPESSEHEEEATKESTIQQISSVEKEKEENYDSPENKHHPAEDILSNFSRITASVETITAAGSVNSDTQQTNSSKEYDLKVEDENSASQCYSPESSEPEEEATKESTIHQISSVEKEKEENYDSPENKHHPAEDILSNFSRITASVETITAAGSVNSDTQQTNSSKEYDLKVEDENSASQCYSPESSEHEEEATKESTMQQISCERFETNDSKKGNNSSGGVDENYENDDGSDTHHSNKGNSNSSQSPTQQDLLETTANAKLCEQTILNIVSENASREKYEILENHAIATFQNSFKERTYSPLNEWNSTTIGNEIANVDDQKNAEEEKNKRDPVVRLLQINGEGHSKSPLMCTNQNLNEEEEEEHYQKMRETIPTTSYMPLKTQFMTTLDTINSVEKRHYNLEQRTLQLPQYGEDEASRSSIVSSASFSSNTSSSQHLVIDHPMDDMKEEKMKPLKMNMKRKYSATGTQKQQQQHVDEGDDNEEPQQKKYLIMEQPEHRTCNESDNFESLQPSWQLQDKKNQLLPQTLSKDDTDGNATQNAGSTEVVTPPVEQEQEQQQQPRTSSPYKSLLLQQLEKPLMPPPVLPPPPTSIMPPSPQTMHGTIETIPQPGSPILTNITTIPAAPVATTPQPPDNTVTKYLCFQCKTGSFDSLTALTDHQMTCLNNTVLPINSSININSKQKSMEAVKESNWHKPMPSDTSRTPKLQYYKCSSCQTYYENWALVLHIREQHNRYACSYCIRVFQTVEKLALHLEIKHDLEQNHYTCEEALRESMILVNGCPKEARYLMCCTCQHVFHEDETFSQHDCSELIKSCTLCGQKGRHTSQCKAHPDANRFAKPRRKKDKAFGTEKTSSSEFLNNAEGPLSLALLSSAAANASSLPVPVPYNQTTINSNNNMPVTSPNCDKPPVSMDCRVDDAGDDSNSSSNMVIDESCTTSHPISQTNPFKELDDEHERLEKQETQIYTRDINEPPDRGVLMMPMANVSLMPTTTKNLIVPKFKLRVPKEFQKSIDAPFTTSESDDDDDNDDDHDHDDEDNDDAVEGNANNEVCEMTESVNVNVLESGIATEKPLLLNAIDIGSNQTTLGNNTTNLSLDEDESVDEPSTNLMRIMEEIERTKMDIQRTKQRHSSHKSSAATTPQPHHSGNHEPPYSTPPTTDSNVKEKETLSTPSLSNPLTETETECGYSEASATLVDGHNQTSAAQDSEKMDIDENIVAPANASGNELELNNGATLQTITTENDALNKKMETNETTTLSTQGTVEELPATTLILSPDNHQLPPIDETIKAKAEEQEHKINICNSDDNKYDNKSMDSEAKQETLPADGIEVAGEETLVTELQLDRPLDKYGMIELVRICLRAVHPVCLYCNYARRIAVNGKSFVLHIIGQHRFTATVDSITAEELHSDTIVAKLKSYLPELEEQYLNLTSYCSWGDGTFSLPFEERQFECFQCRFMTTVHKELYLHNRKMHLRTAILCFMCRVHFFSFSEILCHICPGIPNKVSTFEVKFRCCLCNLDGIPSPFRLMVHLRKRHFVCDVCLEDCRDQSKLSAHVWKHKLHHLCYRCGIAYRNKLDITKHLFWKHGTESTICKRCLQKRWPHVYHFCIPPSQFTCESCNLCFSKAVYLRVHKRLHAGDFRYPCAADNCEEKFISRKLLLKHAAVHDAMPPSTVPEGYNKSEENLNEEKMETETDRMLEMERKKETLLEVKEAELMKIKMETLDNVKGEKETTKKRPLTMLNNQENTSTITTTIIPTTSTNEKPKELCCNSIINEKQKKKRRVKKHKKAKELLDDLNLTAPNLSESDSSSCDSESDTKTKSEFDALPPVMLSPPSEAEDKEDEEKNQQQEEVDEMMENNSESNSNTNAAGQMIEIWKNVVKTQLQQIGIKDDVRDNLITEANYTTTNYPTPGQLHVAYSDHDYCTLFSLPKLMVQTPIGASPVKLGKSPRHSKQNADNSSNSSTDSSSSSDSSCSCGSNCSCSSSDSDSSSTSSSSNHSDSSLASNNTLRKRHRKKSEKDRLRKSKSESVSPQKNHNKYNTTQINVEDVVVTEGSGGGSSGGLQGGDQCDKDKSPNGNKELSFHESDLETNESETDEEFYDEHPQKLANELLAKKRAQLLAQTRLSPSHNFDIVENSRPSTPSLPEEMMSGHEKSRVKVKKKKRDRKNSCKTLNANILQHNNNNNNNNTAISNSLLQQQQQPSTLTNLSVYRPHKWTREQSLNITGPPASIHHSSLLSFNNNFMGRASEGSSCSDIDGSLKRSKRARRPNKFYGYTSDDEVNLGQSLMIGMKSYKPQPPPQLTWRKEDLPTPSKSLLNSKRNKMNKKHRNSTELTSNSKKKLKLSLTLDEEEKSLQKRKKSSKKRENKLPPIPPLKIKQSQLALSNNNNNNIQAQQDDNNSTDSSSSAEEEEEEEEETEQNIVLNNISHTTAAITLPFNKTNHSFTGPPPLSNPLTALLPQAPPMPPTPQTTAFNHKIPPALLPNPDFATLQYFKANNIRYPIRPPAGARQPREGESVYCYCRCPYDEVSEMIACDGENCLIEWFHFECVGIMVAPQGKWFCAECRPKYSEELYPTNTLQATTTGISNV